jgi:hypothetical protein
VAVAVAGTSVAVGGSGVSLGVHVSVGLGESVGVVVGSDVSVAVGVAESTWVGVSVGGDVGESVAVAVSAGGVGESVVVAVSVGVSVAVVDGAGVDVGGTAGVRVSVDTTVPVSGVLVSTGARSDPAPGPPGVAVEDSAARGTAGKTPSVWRASALIGKRKPGPRLALSPDRGEPWPCPCTAGGLTGDAAGFMAAMLPAIREACRCASYASHAARLRCHAFRASWYCSQCCMRSHQACCSTAL